VTVALLGVGADSTNVAPTPPVYPDRTFEYVPIPEAQGPEGTTEERTYGTTALQHQDRSMADLLDAIWPRPWKDNRQYTGDRLAEWPLHYDPNFAALTYGETTSRGAYTTLLSDLEPGDGVAFYTGLQGEDSRYKHRYLIGYFTVATVLDCRQIERGGEGVSFEALSPAEQDDLMAAHSENAHAKRFQATGELANGDGLVVVDGTEPGGLLERAVPISEHSGGGHHYLTDEFQGALSPEPGGNEDRNAYLGGIKPAHRLRLSVAEFRQRIGEPRF
jgi:hypothetical protein